MKTGKKCTICKLGEETVSAIEKDFMDGVTKLDLSKLYNISYWSICAHFKNHFVAHPLTEREMVDEESGIKQSETQVVRMALNQNIDSIKTPDPDDEPDTEPDPDDMSFQPLPMPDPTDDRRVKINRRLFAEWVEQSQGSNDPYSSTPER